MDRVLKRQLRKLGLTEDDLPNAETWPKLLETLSESYQGSDKERRLLEHSIQVNSDEMHHLHLRLKEKVKRRSIQLNDSEIRQKTIFETLADGVVIISGKGVIEGFNRAAEGIFGYPKEEIIGQSVSVLMPKEDQKQHDSYVRKTVIRGRSDIFHRSRELLGITKNGKQFPLELNVAPLDNETGGFVGVLRDVSERKAHENELIKAKDAAESSNRAKSSFLANMSHELRTPLNAILGFAELFEYAPNLNQQYKKNAEEIHTAGTHLLTLINEILDMSRIESGNIQLSNETIHLQDLIKKCFSLSQNAADKNGINLIWQGEQDFILRADYTRVKQVLLNLLSNAIKYNKPSGRVICSCEQSLEGLLKIKVTDTGLGIESSLLSGLFEPFNRLGAENGVIEGTGLGLSITKKLVEIMGGSIGVESTKGVGSCFWIELAGESLQQSAEEVSNPCLINNTNKTECEDNKDSVILYIEDNPASQRLLQRVSELSGNFSLIVSNSAEEGLETAAKIKPAMILMDIDLPGMNGYEAFLRLQQSAETSQIPVVVTSVNTQQQDIKKAMNMGFEAYLAKPIQIPELQEVIRTVLNKTEPSRINKDVYRI